MQRTIDSLIAGQELYSVGVESTVLETARYMSEKRVGAVSVLEGNKLVWYDRIGDKDRRSTTEPDASFWRRIGVNMLRVLPIESQL